MKDLRSLIGEIPEVEECYRLYNGFKMYFDVPRFIEWKTSVLYQLEKLPRDDYIEDTIDIAKKGFSGWEDENNFAELTSRLKNILEGMDDMNPSEIKVKETNKVFIVHGHDKDLRNDVELYLRRVGIEPIILSNEADKGRTVIEKFEECTDEVKYAIILYTACDEGKAKEKEILQPRARQNVVFEHGYFCAKLGRANIFALYDKGVEVPSDLKGVIFTSIEADWKSLLRRELSSAGIDADWSKA